MGRRSDRRSSLSTLFEVRARKSLLYVMAFAAAAGVTWYLAR
jgi:hypothetical protein